MRNSLDPASKSKKPLIVPQNRNGGAASGGRIGAGIRQRRRLRGDIGGDAIVAGGVPVRPRAGQRRLRRLIQHSFLRCAFAVFIQY